MRKVITAVLGGLLVMAAWVSPASAAPANQRFVLTDSNSGSTFTGSGPVGGTGVQVNLSYEETEDSFVEVNRVDFSAGSVFIEVHGADTSFSYDEDTCTGRFTGGGTYEITGGTKAYDGVTGTGTFRYRGGFSGCDEETGSYHVVVRAKGHTSWD